jgi:hypothetical protein
MQHEDTLTAIEFAGLSTYETWMHYCNMGGHLDHLEFNAYLHGLYTLPSHDADVVSQSVNELIDDLCGADDSGLCRAPYSSARRTGNGASVLAAGAQDVEDVVLDDGFFADVVFGDGSFGDGDWFRFEDGPDDGPVTVPVDDLARPHTDLTFGSLFMTGLDLTGLAGRPGIPLPPGSPLELLGEILDSGVIGRILSSDRR